MSDIIDKGQELNLTIRQGATFGAIVCTLKDETGTPIDLTGMTFRAQVRKTPNSRKSSGFEAVTALVDAVNGQFSFTFPADKTATLAAGATENDADSLYYWDMEMVNGSAVTPLFYGQIKVFREVTKDD